MSNSVELLVNVLKDISIIQDDCEIVDAANVLLNRKVVRDGNMLVQTPKTSSTNRVLVMKYDFLMANATREAHTASIQDRLSEMMTEKPSVVITIITNECLKKDSKYPCLLLSNTKETRTFKEKACGVMNSNGNVDWASVSHATCSVDDEVCLLLARIFQTSHLVTNDKKMRSMFSQGKSMTIEEFRKFPIAKINVLYNNMSTIIDSNGDIEQRSLLFDSLLSLPFSTSSVENQKTNARLRMPLSESWPENVFERVAFGRDSDGYSGGDSGGDSEDKDANLDIVRAAFSMNKNQTDKRMIQRLMLLFTGNHIDEYDQEDIEFLLSEHEILERELNRNMNYDFIKRLIQSLRNVFGGDSGLSDFDFVDVAAENEGIDGDTFSEKLVGLFWAID